MVEGHDGLRTGLRQLCRESVQPLGLAVGEGVLIPDGAVFLPAETSHTAAEDRLEPLRAARIDARHADQRDGLRPGRDGGRGGQNQRAGGGEQGESSHVARDPGTGAA
jgi:hypothetical protein